MCNLSPDAIATVMDRLSINEVTTYRWTFEQDVAHYRNAEISSIGVWRQKLSDFGEEKGIELLEEFGLSVSSLLWAGGFTGSDGRTFKDSLQDAYEAIELAADMNARCLTIYSGARAGHTVRHARGMFTEALGLLCRHGQQHGVQLAIEPMHPRCAADWTFVRSLDDCLKVISELDAPNLKLIFDTYHLAHDEQNIERIAEIVPHVALVQLGDRRSEPQSEPHRCALGVGTLPISQIIAAFEEAGYDGPYEVELMGEDFEHCDYHQLLAECKSQFSQWLSG